MYYVIITVCNVLGEEEEAAEDDEEEPRRAALQDLSSTQKAGPCTVDSDGLPAGEDADSRGEGGNESEP